MIFNPRITFRAVLRQISEAPSFDKKKMVELKIPRATEELNRVRGGEVPEIGTFSEALG